MSENAVSVHPYFIYAGVSFLFLVMLAMLAALFRLLLVVGRIEGRLIGLENAVADLREQVAELRRQVALIQEQVAILNERLDLLLRHRHSRDTGSVVLTPGEREPVAD